jgi:hypothetical protein
MRDMLSTSASLSSRPHGASLTTSGESAQFSAASVLVPFFSCTLLSPLQVHYSAKVSQHRWAGSAVSQHSRASRVLISIHFSSSKVLSIFFFQKTLEACINYTPRTTKVLMVAALGRTDKHKEKSQQAANVS